MYLLFDTETTGIPSYTASASDPKQARIVQLAAVLLDEKYIERQSFCFLIKPSGDNWIMNPGAQKAHGISKEDCLKYGIEIGLALDLFNNIYDRSMIRIAHNIKFDSRMIEIEQMLCDIAVDASWGVPNFNVCTMVGTTEICKLPGRNGAYKWPKLQELHTFLFGQPFEKAHDALADVRATARCFRHLKENQLIA